MFTGLLGRWKPQTALMRNSYSVSLLYLWFYFLFFLIYRYLNHFHSLHFSAISLETLELLMPARKHILLQSEEYLCSASNTNRRRFKYCSSGVCLGGSVRVRQRVCASEVEPLLVVYTKGWAIMWACMCACDCMCVPTGYFCSLWGVQLKWTIGSAALHPTLHDTTDDQQKEGFGFVRESGILLGQINGQKYCEFLAPKVMRDS